MAAMTKSKKVCEKCGLHQSWIVDGYSVRRLKWTKKLGITEYISGEGIGFWKPFSECRQCDRAFEHLVATGKL